MTVFEGLGHAAGGLSNHVRVVDHPPRRSRIEGFTQPSLAISTFRQIKRDRSDLADVDEEMATDGHG